MAKAKKSATEALNKYAVSGIHAVEALLLHGDKKFSLYARQFPNKRITQLLALAKVKHIPVTLLDKHAFDEYAHRYQTGEHHQGIIAVCDISSTEKNLDLPELLKNIQGTPLLLILDGVQDPHNLGACLRSANAAGANAVIIPKDRAVPVTAVVRKVASGAAEMTPVITVTNLARTLSFLKEQGIWLYGLAGESKKMLYTADFTSPSAFVLGAEDEGLRKLTRDSCDELLSIPMSGSVPSLNVSVATGICLFEAVRQRGMLR